MYMETLYELSNKFNNIIDMLDCASVEELDDSVIKEIEKINEEFDIKANNIAIIINSLENEISILSNELERLTTRKKSKEKKIKRLKQYLIDNMIYTGKTKITTPLYNLSIRNSYKTIIDDSFYQWAKDNNKLDLFQEKTTFTPNKTAIKEQIENGTLDCPYAQISENQNVVIK